MTRVVAVIDGEHYAPVVRDALDELPYEVVAALLVGGREKLKGGEEYGVPLVPTLERAVAEHAPELVFDLSDEPVLSPRRRLELASRALATKTKNKTPDTVRGAWSLGQPNAVSGAAGQAARCDTG